MQRQVGDDVGLKSVVVLKPHRGDGRPETILKFVFKLEERSLTWVGSLTVFWKASGGLLQRVTVRVGMI